MVYKIANYKGLWSTEGINLQIYVVGPHNKQCSHPKIDNKR
mgnify:CR=1 FL=1|jgi:hypothetical protein